MFPFGHSLFLKETYENFEEIFQKFKHEDHSWQNYGDLKIMYMLLVQQNGYTKFSCFLCL